MAKKAVKKEEFGEMSDVELQAKLRESQSAYFKTKFRHATSPIKNPMEIRQLRRQIARLKTWIRRKEVPA